MNIEKVTSFIVQKFSYSIIRSYAVINRKYIEVTYNLETATHPFSK